MKINLGKINKKNEYIKEVSFSKAVLWMKKELSLNPNIVKNLKEKNVKVLKFIDKRKNEVWKFKLSEILEKGKFVSYGQEVQLYFPIYLAIKSKFIKSEPKLDTIGIDPMVKLKAMEPIKNLLNIK